MRLWHGQAFHQYGVGMEMGSRWSRPRELANSIVNIVAKSGMGRLESCLFHGRGEYRSRALPHLLLHQHLKTHPVSRTLSRTQAGDGTRITLTHGQAPMPSLSLPAPKLSYSGLCCCAPLNSPSGPALQQARLRHPADGS